MAPGAERRSNFYAPQSLRKILVSSESWRISWTGVREAARDHWM